LHDRLNIRAVAEDDLHPTLRDMHVGKEHRVTDRREADRSAKKVTDLLDDAR
jgi:hypothetical protein